MRMLWTCVVSLTLLQWLELYNFETLRKKVQSLESHTTDKWSVLPVCPDPKTGQVIEPDTIELSEDRHTLTLTFSTPSDVVCTVYGNEVRAIGAAK